MNSAIVLRSNNGIQASVFTERSTGGSAELLKNTIELIQNRRTLTDDGRWVQEPLNETDSDGIGIKVNARYWLHIFDTEK